MTINTSATPDSGELRAGLVAAIRRRGTFQTPQVEAAFLAVPRHVFLPGVAMQEAYSAQVVVTKRGEDGSALSSASDPNLVAWMLEQLQVQPGQRVLEIGAATGINAALLAELVGPTGQVTTVEIDEELATRAQESLKAAGYPQVTVVRGDGADGHPPGAPYDRIIVTAGAWDLPRPWWQQLALGGRIVVPLVLHSSGLTRSLAFDRVEPDRMVSDSARVCGFVPMRGAIARPHSTVNLADDLTLQFDTSAPPDEPGLQQAFTRPGEPHWTGITIEEGQQTEHLDLWLATAATGFGRLAAGPRARRTGVADPTLRWAGACLHEGGSLAYLTLRELDVRTEELGVVAHSAEPSRLADRLLAHLRDWDQQRPTQPTITAVPAHIRDRRPLGGYPIDKPATRLTVSW